LLVGRIANPTYGFLERGQRFLDSVLGGTFTWRDLAHPNLTAACAAAEGVLAVARHFDKFHAEQFKQLARSGESAVVATEIAWVVEGHFVMREFVLDGQLAFFKQLQQGHGVMLDLKRPAELRIFVLERVERVRVGGDDLLELRFAERRHVLFDELLEQTFFAHAAHVVARVGFVLVHNAEVQAALIEEPRHHFGVRDDAFIEGSGITDEPQMFHGFFGCILDGEFHLLRPFATQPFAFAHPIAIGGERLKRILHATVNFVAVNQHAAADVHDVCHRFVADRTHADTSVTRCARPNSLRGDNALSKRNQQSVGVRAEGRFLEKVTLVYFQCRRGERSPAFGKIRGADILTAIALHAGVGIQNALPRKVMDEFRARINLRGRVELTARILFGESEIDGRDRKVRVLAARDVGDDEHHPADADPPCGMNACFAHAENAVEKTRDGHERIRARVETIGLTQQARADVHDDEDVHDERVPRLTAYHFGVEQNIVAIRERLVFDEEAPREHERDAKQQRAAHQVRDQVEGVDDGRAQKRECKIFSAVDEFESWDETLQHVHQIHERVREETEEQPKMNRADPFARFENSLLEQNGNACFEQTRGDVLQFRRGSSFADGIHNGLDAVKKEPRRYQRKKDEDDFFNRCEQRALHQLRSSVVT